jgi:hypothetical protein
MIIQLMIIQLGFEYFITTSCNMIYGECLRIDDKLQVIIESLATLTAVYSIINNNNNTKKR